MKSKFLLFSHSRLAACGLILGLGVFVGGSAQAQIIVGNAKFDNPLSYPGLNWKVVYVKGGPSDFACKGRTTRATYTAGGAATGFGGNFKPFHDAPMHAYFTQTISNLTVGASYAVTNWMHKPGQGDEGWYEGARVYLEAVGGLGSKTAEYVPDLNLVKQEWQRFAVTNTPNARGELEIRLHFSHDGASGDKWFYVDGWYDDVGVTALSTKPPCDLTIATQPESRAAVRGSTVSFSVVATTSAGQTNYQWLLNESNLSGQTNDTLIITNLQDSDFGPYRVLVNDGICTVTSTPAILSLADLTIVIQPEGRAAVLGSTVSFFVFATTSAGRTNYQWQLNDSNLSGQTNKTLIITNLQNSGFGPYQVLVNDGVCTVTSTPAILTLAVSPSLYNFTRSGTTLIMYFPTEVGPTYVIETKTNIDDLVWTPVATYSGDGLPKPFTQSTQQRPQSFFRVRPE